ATANARVTADVAEQLGTDVLVLRGSLDRESLRLGVVRLKTPEQRLAWLADHLAEQPGSGIVYCLTVAATQEVADYLRSRGHEVAAYSGQTEPTERHALEQALVHGRVKALIATSALGMGFDEERYRRVTEAREREQRAMLDYIATDGCRMRFLRDQLDDPGAVDCGRCDNCGGLALTAEISAAAVEEAEARLSRPGVVVEPR